MTNPLNDLRTQINELYAAAEACAKRTERPTSNEFFLAELDELEALTDKGIVLQDALLQLDRSVFDADISLQHDRIYEVSQMIKPRLVQLNEYATAMTQHLQKEVTAIDAFIAELEVRLGALNARERELLKDGYVVNMKELNDILEEKQIINNELERWIN